MKRLCIAIMLIFLIPISSNNIFACWEALTIEDMIELSDYTLIVNIDNLESINEIKNIEYWNMAVDFVLEGDSVQRSETMWVASEKVSTNYNPQYRGEYVLVFMEAYSFGLSPLTPDAIISIDVLDGFDEANIENGEDLLKYIEISTTSVELIEYVKGTASIKDLRDHEIEHRLISEDKEEVTKVEEISNNKDRRFIIAILITMAVLLAYFVIFIIRRKKA